MTHVQKAQEEADGRLIAWFSLSSEQRQLLVDVVAPQLCKWYVLNALILHCIDPAKDAFFLGHMLKCPQCLAAFVRLVWLATSLKSPSILL